MNIANMCRFISETIKLEGVSLETPLKLQVTMDTWSNILEVEGVDPRAFKAMPRKGRSLMFGAEGVPKVEITCQHAEASLELLEKKRRLTEIQETVRKLELELADADV